MLSCSAASDTSWKDERSGKEKLNGSSVNAAHTFVSGKMAAQALNGATLRWPPLLLTLSVALVLLLIASSLAYNLTRLLSQWPLLVRQCKLRVMLRRKPPLWRCSARQSSLGLVRAHAPPLWLHVSQLAPNQLGSPGS